jgi:hypothetical protein
VLALLVAVTPMVIGGATAAVTAGVLASCKHEPDDPAPQVTKEYKINPIPGKPAWTIENKTNESLDAYIGDIENAITDIYNDGVYPIQNIANAKLIIEDSPQWAGYDYRIDSANTWAFRFSALKEDNYIRFRNKLAAMFYRLVYDNLLSFGNQFDNSKETVRMAFGKFRGVQEKIDAKVTDTVWG